MRRAGVRCKECGHFPRFHVLKMDGSRGCGAIVNGRRISDDPPRIERATCRCKGYVPSEYDL